MSDASLRIRKKQQTRDALIEAAFSLADQHGFGATTIDQIAECAGVSRRTFFRYFGTKDAVIFARQPGHISTFRAALAGATESSPFSAIRAGFLAVAAEYMADREAVLVQQRIVDASSDLIAIESELDLEWEHLIADALSSAPGGSRGGSRWSRIVAGAVMGAVRAGLREWIADDGRGDLVAIGTEVLDTLERAFDDLNEQA